MNTVQLSLFNEPAEAIVTAYEQITSAKPAPSKYINFVQELCATMESNTPGSLILAVVPSGLAVDKVPSRVVFLTDGPTRKVKLGQREIILQRTTPRNMATAGRPGGTLIQALRHLGPKQIDPQVVAKIRRHIANQDRASLRRDLVHAPAWIADLLRPLTEPTSGS